MAPRSGFPPAIITPRAGIEKFCSFERHENRIFSAQQGGISNRGSIHFSNANVKPVVSRRSDITNTPRTNPIHYLSARDPYTKFARVTFFFTSAPFSRYEIAIVVKKISLQIKVSDQNANRA